MLVTSEGASIYGIASKPRTTKGQRRLAALLSLFIPGLGQLYRGALGRAVAVFVIIDCGALVALWFVATTHGPLQLPIFALGKCLRLVGSWDAYHFEAPDSSGYSVHSRSRQKLYIGAVVFSMIAVQLLLGNYVRHNWLQLFRVPTGSMAPLMLAGDYIVTQQLPSALHRGDVVVYRAGASSYIKRVVGVAGDTLSMNDGRLFVNGQPVAEPYATQKATNHVDSLFAWQRQYVLATVNPDLYKPSLGSWGPILIPAGRYFVLGDNRDNSMDSRYSGFVSQKDLRALALMIYFSIDPRTKRARWARIGKRLQ